MTLQSVDIERWSDAGVSVITLQAAHNDNRLTLALLQQLTEALQQAVASTDCRAILLRSSGTIFCGGMDLGMVAQASDSSELRAAISLYSDILLALNTSSKPVVCLLDGAAIGGGVGLVAACDIVYALPRATMQMSETLFGLIPANVLPYLLGLRIPMQKARYLILTARRLNSAEARELNLIDQIVEPQDADRELRALFKQLLRSGPEALAATKRFTRILLQSSPDAAIGLARDTLIELLGGEEARNALVAYAAGDTPAWFRPYRPARPLYEQVHEKAHEQAHEKAHEKAPHDRMDRSP